MGTFQTSQPDSLVATSLVQWESTQIKVSILDICNNKFGLNSIPPTQVQPFATADVSLQSFYSTLSSSNNNQHMLNSRNLRFELFCRHQILRAFQKIAYSEGLMGLEQMNELELLSDLVDVEYYLCLPK